MPFDHSQTPLQHFRLLIERGMNVDMIDGSVPLDVQLAIVHRWDLVAHVIAHGADFRKPRSDDGRTVASVMAEEIATSGDEGKALPPDLLRVQSLISEKR